MIPDLHPIMAMESIKDGVKPGLFLDCLYADPPLNMDELRARSTRYISIGENVEKQENEWWNRLEFYPLLHNKVLKRGKLLGLKTLLL